MKIGDLFIKLGLQKGEFDKGIDDAKTKTSGLGSVFGKIGGLATAAWAAVGVGAVMAFNKVKNSTDTLSTQWEIFMGGMTSATDEFFRTIATGDWSNFIDHIKEAIRVGRDYADMLDQIEEMQRAGTMAEAKMLKQNTQLEIDAADQTKTIEARKAAAQQRIKNEEELGAVREKIAQKAYDNEKAITMQQTKLSSDELEKVISDLDSIDKEKAKSYNEDYDRMIAVNSSKIQVENELSKRYTDSEKLYGKAVRKMGDTTDEQLNKMVDAYMKLAIAQESVIGNTRRIRIRLSGLDDKAAEAADNSAKSQLETLKKINDELEAQRILRQEFKGQKMQPLSGKQTPDQLPIGFMDTNQLQLGDMGSSWKENIAKNKKFTEEYLQDMKDFTDELNRTISSGIADAIGSLASGLGELASGAITGKEFGNQVLQVIGSFMVQMGMLFITTGSLFTAFEAAISSMNGPLALGIGIALVAAGSAISGLAKKGVSGATKSVSASGYSNYTASSGAAVLSGNVVFELEGTKLRGALNNTDRRNTLIR